MFTLKTNGMEHVERSDRPTDQRSPFRLGSKNYPLSTSWTGWGQHLLRFSSSRLSFVEADNLLLSNLSSNSHSISILNAYTFYEIICWLLKKLKWTLLKVDKWLLKRVKILTDCSSGIFGPSFIQNIHVIQHDI